MIQQFIRLLIQRNFIRNGFHSLINITGLSVGLSAFILFILFVNGIKDYDRFHDNYANLYRVVCEQNDSRGDYSGTPAQLGPFLMERIPEIKDAVRFEERKNVVITHNQEKYFESNLVYAYNNFFTTFSFPILHGNTENPIPDENAIVLTKGMAEKYFGTDNPIGQSIKIGKNEESFTVTAIAEDCPKKSSIQFDFVISFERLAKKAYWGMFNYYTYLLIDDNNAEQTESKIKQCVVDREDYQNNLDYLRLQPMSDLRFETMRGNSFTAIDRKHINIFLFASVFILFLAVINYTNLASAISIKRSKEIAVKKTFGSQRSQIIREILLESVFFAIVALMFAFILVELISPYFGKLINEELTVSYKLIPYFFAITVLVGLIAGVYPAVYNSRYQIMQLFKGSELKGTTKGKLRNSLVVIQFGITGFLLICSLTISKQLNFLMHKDIGFNVDNLYEVPVHWDDIKLDALKSELKKHSGIDHVSTSSFTAGEDGWNQTAHWEGMDEESQINMFMMEADKDFIKTLGLKPLELIDNFEQLKINRDEYYLLNKSARDYIGWKNSINKMFSIYSGENGKVAGVVDNFNFRSLHHKVSPSAILLSPVPVPEYMQIRIAPGYTEQGLNFLQQAWKNFAPVNASLQVTSVEDDFRNLYATENKMKKVITVFTIIAMFISLLGLFGLSTYIILQRTKEIGIRKVNGANSRKIAIMFVVDFTKWTLLSLVLSIPLAIIYLRKWLQNFSYKTSLSADIIVGAAIFILLISVIGVLFQSHKASRRNPIDSLRYE